MMTRMETLELLGRLSRMRDALQEGVPSREKELMAASCLHLEVHRLERKLKQLVALEQEEARNADR